MQNNPSIIISHLCNLAEQNSPQDIPVAAGVIIDTTDVPMDLPFGCRVDKMQDPSLTLLSAANTCYQTNNAINHAEILLINILHTIYTIPQIKDYNIAIYSTLEPCRMCASAMFLSKIKTIYFGITDEKFGGIVSHSDDRYKIQNIYYPFCESRIISMMQKFFKPLR